MTPVDSAFAVGDVFIFPNYSYMCMPKVSPEIRYNLLDVLNYLNKHSLTSIEIIVHTDYRGFEADNAKFCLDRAMVMEEFLIENGLDSLRVHSIGVGESEPLTITNELKKAYSKFEVGKQLTEEYIKTFDPEWQEIANMLNRRTEIRLIRVVE